MKHETGPSFALYGNNIVVVQGRPLIQEALIPFYESTWSMNSIQAPDGEIASDLTNSHTNNQEPSMPPGFSGRGKMIMSCTTGGPSMLMLGDASPDGAWTNDPLLYKWKTNIAPQKHVSPLYSDAHDNTVPGSCTVKALELESDQWAMETSGAALSMGPEN